MDKEKKKEIKIIKGPLPSQKIQSEYENYYQYFEKSTIIKMIEE